MAEERIAMVRKAIDNIINDIMQKAYHHSMNHPQNSDTLNVLLKNVREDHEMFINRLYKIKDLKDRPLIDLELNQISKNLKKRSLVYLSEIQKLKEKDEPKL